MSQPAKTQNSEKSKKLNFLEELYQNSERKNLYLNEYVSKLREVPKCYF